MVSKYDNLSYKNNYVDNLQEILKIQGYDFATGVPCGVLKHFISNFHKDFIHISAQNEPEAVGIATGAYLGGHKPIIYMQNSGLLKSTNEFGSLLIPYQIPVLALVAYRGCFGEDAPQHLHTGKITKPMLESLNISYNDISEINKSANLTSDFPKVILVERNELNFETKTKNLQKTPKKDIPCIMQDFRKNDLMNREYALDSIIMASNKKDAIFSTTGLISRSLYERHDSPNQFYNTGSFGLVSSEGLGFALSKPNVKTIVIDGDGSILTNLGSLITIGHYKPKNLIHIIIDNESYGSCSEERTLSKNYDLAKIASICGYKKTIIVDDPCDLIDNINNSNFGPTMIQTKIQLGGRRDFKRPLDLEYIAYRFKKHFEND